MTKHISADAAETLIAKALEAHSVSSDNAKEVAKALVAAEIDGQGGHGFSRVSDYCGQVQSGKVKGNIVPKITQSGISVLKVDAGEGFAYPAITAAIKELSALAKKTGIAIAAITRSHHAGQIGAHVEKLAEHGLVALMVANTPKAMAPWGGYAPLFGTNPIAFAAPRKGKPPLVIDLSLSKVARGKVMAAAKRGDSIPDDWALDKNGHPTTDPQEALQGTMIPAGDAKGAALALVVEILAATLTGSKHSFEATSFFEAEGDPVNVGQLMIAIDPQVLAGASFGDRLETLLTKIEAQDGARIPGNRRLKARAESKAHGFSVPEHLLDEAEKRAKQG